LALYVDGNLAAMRRLSLFLVLPFLLAACAPAEPKGPVVSKEPVSVRG